MNIQIGGYRIRHFDFGDAESIVRYADNPKIAANLRDRFPSPYTRADAEAFLSSVVAASPRTVFAIAAPVGENGAEDEAVGSIGLMPGEDVHRFTAELGYWLAEPFWGKGIMTSAVKAVTEYGFAEFGLYRIYAEPYSHNGASARVLEKAGFVFEGRLKGSVFKNGKILDQLMYAVIREER